MDLTAAVSGIQQSKVLNEVQFRVAKKILDSQRDQGAAAIQLLQAASGTAGGPSTEAAAATGVGGQVDTFG